MVIFLLMFMLLMPQQAIARNARGRAPAQTVGDTLTLATVRALAADRDPRAVQSAYLEEISRLTVTNLRSRHLPQLMLSGQATYQNEVPNLPAGALGSGLATSTSGPSRGSVSPPLDQYRAQVEMNWLLYNVGRTSRQASVEAMRLKENLAGMVVTLDRLQEGATEAYFSVLFFQIQQKTLAVAAQDLEARLELLQARVKEGAALPAHAAALEAELITLRQQIQEAESRRKTSLVILSDLIQQDLSENTVLIAPDISDQLLDAVLEDDVSSTTHSLTGARINSPQLQLLENRAGRLQAEARVAAAGQLPQLSLFGQAGYGRPGPFNFLSRDLNDFGLIGVRMQWSIWDWGQARRSARIMQQQASITSHERDALARQIVRDIADEQSDISRIKDMLVDDQRVLELREQIWSTARAQLEDGVMLPADYVDRLTDYSTAEFALETHQLELARARVKLLTTLGRYPDESNVTLTILDAAKQ